MRANVLPRGARRRVKALSVLGVAAVALGATVGMAQAHDGSSPPVDRAAPWTPKVASLVRVMTLDEKISLVHGGTDPTPKGQAGYTPGIDRLGIPPRRDVDALGINVFKDATAWPTRLGIGATFDRGAAATLGRSEGTEGRALDMDLLYGPQLDPTRSPNWTRNPTTFGEDPYLAGELGSEEVEGVQSRGLMDELKHFAIYNDGSQVCNGFAPPIPTTCATSRRVDDQTAREIYLAPFEKAIKKAKPTSVMCSYAHYQITGTLQAAPTFACQNGFVLNTILRDQWSFKGFVLSDYGGTHSLSILQGLDTEFPGQNFFGATLKNLADPASPSFDQTYADALNRSVARILYQMQRFGLLACASPTGPVAHCSLPRRPKLDKGAGIATSRTLAEKAAVLLRNEDEALPLGRSDLDRGVAVVGPTADLLPSSPGGERSRGFGDRNMISPLDALRTASPHGKIAFEPGIDRVGTVVPASALPGGLLRTQSDSSATQVDSTIDYTGARTLTPGVTYTWTGKLQVPADDTYALWLQRTPGGNAGGVADPTGGRGGSASGPVSLSVDGATQALTTPSTILPNTYPGGPTLAGGQYEGLANSGNYVSLAKGTHDVKITFAVSSAALPPVNLRFTWSPLQASIDKAVAATAKAKTAIVFVDDANTTGDLHPLGPYQDQLVNAVADANRNTVVVLNTGNPVAMPWLSKVKSVVEMWYPGQEGGTATADVLLGRTSVGGKLPITFPASAQDTPFAGHPERDPSRIGTIEWSEGLFMGYRWYDQQNIKPLFAFGDGLSYTRFRYSGLDVRRGSHGGIDVRFSVRNVGHATGDEVPQVYVGPAPSAPANVQQAVRKLVQFKRVTLRPGAERHLTLHVSARQLSYWSTDEQQWVRGGGRRDIYVGSSSRDIRGHTSAHL
jgi:beta-glucosidase